jgi:hypothetical protein
MVALVGDAELDEGNIYEALLEGWKHDVRNTWWVIDYNRQSLDSVSPTGCSASASTSCSLHGLGGRHLKYGKHLLEAAFAGAGRRGAAAVDRRLPEPALLGADLQGRRRLAQAPAGRPRRSGPGVVAARRRDDDELRADDQPRRPRPGAVLEAFRADRRRPPDLLHRLHDQGLRPALRRPQGQPCRPDDAGADGGAFRASPSASARAGSGSPSPARCRAGRSRPSSPRALQRRGHPRGATRRARRGAGAPAGAGGGRGPCRPRRASARSSTSSPARSGRCRAHRHHLAGRHRLDQPRPLGEPRGLFDARERPTLFRDEKVVSAQKWECRRRASTSSSASPR